MDSWLPNQQLETINLFLWPTQSICLESGTLNLICPILNWKKLNNFNKFSEGRPTSAYFETGHTESTFENFFSGKLISFFENFKIFDTGW